MPMHSASAAIAAAVSPAVAESTAEGVPGRRVATLPADEPYATDHAAVPVPMVTVAVLAGMGIGARLEGAGGRWLAW